MFSFQLYVAFWMYCRALQELLKLNDQYTQKKRYGYNLEPKRSGCPVTSQGIGYQSGADSFDQSVRNALPMRMRASPLLLKSNIRLPGRVSRSDSSGGVPPIVTAIIVSSPRLLLRGIPWCVSLPRSVYLYRRLPPAACRRMNHTLQLAGEDKDIRVDS